MAFPSYTYTFVNGSTADAAQVNQNFSDILNGISDTTKDISVSAATVAGTATLNGNVILGNASGKTITVTGSLSSSFPVGANTTYDFGSATLGLRAVYIGGTSTFTTAIKSAATATWTLNLPVTAGSAGQALVTDGSGNTTWTTPATAKYYAGYSSGATWATSSATFADPTVTGTNALTQRQGSGITVTTAATNIPGIVFTPSSSSAVYRITASFQGYNAVAGNNFSFRLYDGTTEIVTGCSQSPGTNGTSTFVLEGIFVPGTASAVTVKVQAAAVAGSTTLGFTAAGAKPIEWTLVQIV